MKTHQLANELILLAKILKKSPNIDLEFLSIESIINSKKSNITYKTESKEISTENLSSALYNLVNLNRVNKQQWLTLIDDYKFDIQIRDRDANRDIVGKILNYLANNPHERDKLISRQNKNLTPSSNELANALNLLLK